MDHVFRVTGEDTSEGWINEGKRLCPVIIPRFLPLKHLQHRVNNGVASVAASVALGLADLPRKEAESLNNSSSQLQSSGLLGSHPSSLKTPTHDAVSVAMARVLDASSVSRQTSMEEDGLESVETSRPGRQGTVAGGKRRGSRRKTTIPRISLRSVALSTQEISRVTPQQPAVTDASKRPRVAAPSRVTTQPTANEPTQFVATLPAGTALSHLRTGMSAAVAIGQISTSSPTVSQTSAHISSVSHSSSLLATNVASLATASRTCTTMTSVLVSLSATYPSMPASLSSTNTVPSVYNVCPVTTTVQQATVQSVSPSDIKSHQPLVSRSSISSVSSLASQVSTVNQPSHLQPAPSSQTLAAAASLLSLPSHLPVTSSLSIGTSQLIQTVSPSTTVSVLPAAAQLMSGGPNTVTLVNQQSLKTIGNVYIVSSGDGQPGRAILLPHQGSSTSPATFSLIPVSAAHVVPSQSLPPSHVPIPEVTMPSTSLSGVGNAISASSPDTVPASTSYPAVSCSHSVATSSFNGKPVITSSTGTSSASGQMDSKAEEAVADSMVAESPDSEVTQAAEELVRLQARSVASKESTAALLLSNPSLLEATTTLLSLQTSAVPLVNRTVTTSDDINVVSQEYPGNETEMMDGQPEAAGDAKENREDKVMMTIVSEGKSEEADERQEVMSAMAVSRQHADKPEGMTQTGVAENKVYWSTPKVSIPEQATPVVDTRNGADGRENQSVSPDQLNMERSAGFPTQTSVCALTIQQDQHVTKDSKAVNSPTVPSSALISATTPLVSVATNAGSSQSTQTSQSMLSNPSTILPVNPTIINPIPPVVQQTPPLLTSQSSQPAVVVCRSVCTVAPHPVAGYDSHTLGVQPIISFPPYTPYTTAGQQGGSTAMSLSSLPSMPRLSPSLRQETTIPLPFPAVPSMSLQSSVAPTAIQSPLTRGDTHMQHSLLPVSSPTPHAPSGAIHLRIQGSTVTACQPTSTPLSDGRISPPCATSRTSPESPFQPIALPPSASSAHICDSPQPAFSDAHNVLDVLRDVTGDSQSQDESDADQLKSIIDELGVSFDDPESFLASDHLSFEASLDPDILSDVFAAISAADTTVCHSSSPTSSAVHTITNELSTSRIQPLPVYERPYAYSQSTHRHNSKGNEERGKRAGHFERSISYPYPTMRPTNVITTRRSSAAASLTEHMDWDDSSGLRHSKRKRKLTAIMTDDPYPAAKTETIMVPSWVKAALA